MNAPSFVVFSATCYHEAKYCLKCMTVALLVGALRYRSEGRGFRFPMLSLEFLINIIFLATLWPWGRLSL
jgi:hypothetical protein